MLMKKRFLSMFALLLMAATGAWAQGPWTSGDCTVTLNNGTMTVSGKGAMANYEASSDRPWNDYRNDVTSVVVESGVTTVGNFVFHGFEKMTSVTLPEGLTRIGEIAFTSCKELTSITIPSTVTSIEYDAFYSCKSVTDVNLYADPANLTWNERDCDDFKDDKATKCHVLAEHLSAYQTKFNGEVNVTFVGDLKPLTPTTYSVTLAEGTEDADKWTVKVGEGKAQAFPVEGLDGGETVTATYSGEKKVKSVKAVKKALDPAKAYLTWDKDQKQLVATEIPTTAIKVENANENVSWAGTYVVEGQVTISGNISLNGEVDLIIKDGAKLTAKQIASSGNNLRIYGQANQSGQLVVNRTNGDAIMNIKTLEVHSAQLTATSSTSSCGGIYGTTTFNVYGGLVDAKGTGAGYGISLNSGGSINIWGGEVKAEGKGTGSYSFGIRCGGTATVTVNGGKLWAENADKKALNAINIQKGEGFTGKIEYSSDKSTWSETVDANAKYVRAGY